MGMTITHLWLKWFQKILQESSVKTANINYETTQFYRFSSRFEFFSFFWYLSKKRQSKVTTMGSHIVYNKNCAILL